MNDTRTRLLEEGKQIIERAKSAGRTMTDDERSQVRANIEAANRLGEKADTDDETELRRRLAHTLRESPLPGQLGRFSAKTAASTIATKFNDGSAHSKALAPSGSEVAPAGLSELAPISLSKPATTLLAVIGAKVVQQPPTFAYLKQTTRTNNAAPVADHAEKPASVYGLTRVEDRLRVVAHLSEPIPRYWLDDSDELRTFLEAELAYGLDLAVEQQLVNGSGTGENSRGILQTSGIQTQAWSSDGYETLRKALTKLQAQGAEQAVVALNPLDFEAMSLVRSTTGEFLATDANMSTDRGGATAPPYGPLALSSWGAPLVLTSALAVGQGVVFDPNAITLYTDGQIAVEWDKSVGFKANEVIARCETRIGVAVRRPLLVVSVDMSA